MSKPETKKSVAQLIIEDAKCREQNCLNAFNQALKEFNCEAQVSMMITPKGNFPQLQFVARTPKDTP